MINTLYPGRPNYTGALDGVFNFVHHDILVETSNNINVRIAYIKEHKPKHERKSRLYHLLYVDIPELTKDWDKACKDWDKALEDWDKAREDWDKAREDWDKACKDWDKACNDWDKVINNHKPEILAYVNKHIPDHRWDGKELRFD